MNNSHLLVDSILDMVFDDLPIMFVQRHVTILRHSLLEQIIKQMNIMHEPPAHRAENKVHP